ncbi:hypothetical protein F4827_002423 [Paraburkholderia bannensis]|uniref:Lipoprotein n=1 Tax=Paraburkholderia bannensis TaxID=765414 RepID=A0A7W9TW92_9BURK|nr:MULTISPECIES: hypothetical protein [Paraburkholderia]MBB3257558.1 hypothetical protein [Paraburkholderia sp. WP4_3_2]MBB6102571.1 hypothetical protein [Paraburkholderia bannensis]
MQSRLFKPSPAIVISVVLATISLAACGPGVGSSAAPDTTSAPGQQQINAALQPAAPVAGPNGSSGAAPADAANPASYTYANDPVQSVEASLAADSQQVAPVMSYAPGDEPPRSGTGTSASGTDSRSTATTRQ